ncbi:MAG: nucleoside-diphosphate sugar epimerase, partial [Rubrivivax sp.]|nr:nucleoside-diphosphate sugar epimerase [Rubrivivax sp.]
AVVSALGADPRSSVFYNRVKGEAEAALRTLGFEQLVIARPSLLVGDRAALGQPVRTGERLGLALSRPFMPLIPQRVRPIEAATVAGALLLALDQGGQGVRVIESAELQQLGSP